MADEYISKQRAKDLMGCCLASAKAEYKAAKDEFTKARFGDYISSIQSMIDVVGSVEPTDVQPVNQWISVKDRLPKEWYEVLAYSEMGKIEQAIYVNGRWKLSAFLGEIVDVTHWQPLPKPPKDGEQNENH